jgi:RNase adaptor protein for sRNA GlmZ degradation
MEYPVKRRLVKRGDGYSSRYYPYSPSDYDSFKARLEGLDADTLESFLVRTSGRKAKTEENMWTMVYGFIKLDPDIIEDVMLLPNRKFIDHLKTKLDHKNTVYK